MENQVIIQTRSDYPDQPLPLKFVNKVDAIVLLLFHLQTPDLRMALMDTDSKGTEWVSVKTQIEHEPVLTRTLTNNDQYTPLEWAALLTLVQATLRINDKIS